MARKRPEVVTELLEHSHRWLSSLADEGTIDEASRQRLTEALDSTFPANPATLVLLVARALDAPDDAALRAACFGAMFFASTSLVDDVQDGDADLDALTTALQMYALALRLAPPDVRDEVTLCTSKMAQGQRLEMAREGWDVGAYARVALLTAGAEFRALLATAAHSAEHDLEPWLELGEVIGQMVHVKCDRMTNDSRVTVLPPEEVKRYSRELNARFRELIAKLPKEAHPPLRRAAGYAC